MTPADLFGVLIRVLGVYLLFLAVRSIFAGVIYSIQIGFSSDVVGQLLTEATPAFLVGLYLLGGARSLTRHCFGRANAAERPEQPGR